MEEVKNCRIAEGRPVCSSNVAAACMLSVTPKSSE